MAYLSFDIQIFYRMVPNLLIFYIYENETGIGIIQRFSYRILLFLISLSKYQSVSE